MSHDVILTETFFSTVEQFETENAKRIINKLEDIGDFPEHFLDRLKNHPGYKLRVGDFRVLIDWDKDNELIYAIDVFERKKKYRELGKYREVWGSWRDNE
ncbi:type II toxin-antitoxin system RelE/ParE family toxin [Natronoarchaeum sp. GCM10025703]|uniref:type II toxin-antitoxin system RelE family toxin n=1 Tax=unclassified Natronoarchaeum TaxID=2620183 RepID=UPI003612A789